VAGGVSAASQDIVGAIYPQILI